MSHKTFDKLVKLMARLRSKNGCPWDRAQTHSSLKKYLIEEAYEVCEAIDSKNSEKLKDELGDFLFQALFHAQIAKEHGTFDIDGVLRASYRKMLRRHPHVFGKHKAKDPEDAYKHWEREKGLEKNYAKRKTLLSGIPKHLPALLKAEKVSTRASRLSLKGPDIGGAIKKVTKGLRQIQKELKRKSRCKHSEKLGDLLFDTVNLARLLDIDAEEALNNSTKKFILSLRRT